MITNRTIEIPEGYEALAYVLEKALNQAAHGKGKERHATGEPFDQQPICAITRRVGFGYPLGQAEKKIEESQRLDTDASIFELLGAINYLAAAVICLEEYKRGQMDELDVAKALKDPRVGDAINDMLIELIRAENLHPVWPEDVVHQVAILNEEAGEAMRAALRSYYNEGGTVEQVRTELIQTGAMAIRALIHLEA